MLDPGTQTTVWIHFEILFHFSFALKSYQKEFLDIFQCKKLLLVFFIQINWQKTKAVNSRWWQSQKISNFFHEILNLWNFLSFSIFFLLMIDYIECDWNWFNFVLKLHAHSIQPIQNTRTIANRFSVFSFFFVVFFLLLSNESLLNVVMNLKWRRLVAVWEFEWMLTVSHDAWQESSIWNNIPW